MNLYSRVPDKGKDPTAFVMDLTTTATAAASTTVYLVERMHGYSICGNIVDTTPGVKTFDSGIAEVDRITFASKAATTQGDYFVIHDYLGGSWAIGLDTVGNAANTPTGAAWVAVPAANKTYLNISAATTGTDVELLVATAINLLVGFSAVITTANSTTHLDCTSAAPGVVTTPAVYSKAGASGSGSVTFGITTPGTATTVSPAADTVTIANHGYNTGVKMTGITTTGTLPAGLSLLTAYYAIRVDANTLKFADSLAHAVAGTAIDITDYGSGVATITATALAGTLKLQASNNAFTDNTDMNLNPNAVWTDIPSSTVTLSAGSTTAFWNSSQVYYESVKIVWASTTGSATLTPFFLAKGT